MISEEAAKKVALRYPDYGHYEPEVRRLVGSLLPLNGITAEQYIESLYLVAKFSSFSGSEWTRQELAAALAAGDSTKTKP